MLKIRLRRMGAIRQPHYRIVVADARAPRDGAFIESLGHYNPRTNPATIQVDVTKYEEWKRKGAQPTEAVVSLVRQFNRAARNAEATADTTATSPSRRTRTASGKGIAKPQPAAEEPVAQAAEASGPETVEEPVPQAAEAATEEAPATSVDSTEEPVLEAATETPEGAAEGETDTDTAS